MFVFGTPLLYPGYADKLCLLVGQYDAANSALNMGLKYAEMALEVSEVLNSLSESEQNLLLANCTKAGQADNKISRYSAILAYLATTIQYSLTNLTLLSN